MGRQRRADTPGTWHHVFNRGVARRAIFESDRDRIEFLRLIGVAHDRFGVTVHAFCLMGNHYHLLVECPDGGLSDAMHMVGSVYVRHFNERVDRDGPLFRDRFADRLVGSDEYLARLVTYIHRNPLAFLPEHQLRSYRWSSLRVYAGDRSTPRWMTSANVALLFGGAAQVVEAAAGHSSRTGPLSSAWWQSAIDLAVDECVHDGSRHTASRTVAVLLSAEPELAELASFPTRRAAQMARLRARRRAEQQPEILEAADVARRLIAA